MTEEGRWDQTNLAQAKWALPAQPCAVSQFCDLDYCNTDKQDNYGEYTTLLRSPWPVEQAGYAGCQLWMVSSSKLELSPCQGQGHIEECATELL